MVRDFTERKREEIYEILDAIDHKEWKPFMTWCGGRAGDFGEWADKLGIPSYTRQIDNYQSRILETNESTRNQIDRIFANVAETDRRYAEIFRNHQEIVKEQMARVQAMTEAMRSASSTGHMRTMLLSEREEDSMSDREKRILSGQEILMRRLEGEGVSPEECKKICDMIMENNPNMLIDLYITDCYSGVDSDKVYRIIKEYYEEHKNDEKLDYAEEILRRYLTAQGIVDAEEQQDIIDMIRANQPNMLLSLYITDCYSSADSKAVRKAIVDYYDKHKMDITIDDVKNIDLGEGMDQTQKETFVACWNMLGQMELSENQIIAVMANMYAESRFSATNAQESYGYKGLYDDYEYKTDDGVGFGICQWALEARKVALEEFANANGGSVYDLETQLAFFQYEMQGEFAGKWEDFLSEPSRDEAVKYFWSSIEITGASMKGEGNFKYEEELKQRTGYADDIADWYETTFSD